MFEYIITHRDAGGIITSVTTEVGLITLKLVNGVTTFIRNDVSPSEPRPRTVIVGDTETVDVAVYRQGLLLQMFKLTSTTIESASVAPII